MPNRAYLIRHQRFCLVCFSNTDTQNCSISVLLLYAQNLYFAGCTHKVIAVEAVGDVVCLHPLSAVVTTLGDDARQHWWRHNEMSQCASKFHEITKILTSTTHPNFRQAAKINCTWICAYIRVYTRTMLELAYFSTVQSQTRSTGLCRPHLVTSRLK